MEVKHGSKIWKLLQINAMHPHPHIFMNYTHTQCHAHILKYIYIHLNILYSSKYIICI